jgi:hypothetical protein
MDMNRFLTGLLNAEHLQPNVKIEVTIKEVVDREFEDGSVKSVVYFEEGLRPCVLNQTRLIECMTAWGPNSENWVGQKLTVSRGKTKFNNKTVDCVAFEAVTATRIPPPPANDRGPDVIDDDVPF